MDRKTIIATVVTFAVTAVLGLVFAAIGGVFDEEIEQHERGATALTEDQIKEVLREVMVADIDGETLTYGQAFSKIDSRLRSIEGALTVLTE